MKKSPLLSTVGVLVPLLFFCSLLYQCREAQVYPEHPPKQVIVFADYLVNHPQKTLNMLNKQLIRPITDEILVQEKKELRPFNISVYPVYCNTGAAVPLMNIQLRQQHIDRIRKTDYLGLEEAREHIITQVQKGWKNFTPDTDNERCRVLASLPVLAQKLSAIASDDLSIVYLSDLVELNCPTRAMERRYCFLQPELNIVDGMSIQKARENLKQPSSRLFKDCIEPFTKKINPSDLDTIDLFLISSNLYTVLPDPRYEYDKAYLYSFWDELFTQIGFTTKQHDSIIDAKIFGNNPALSAGN
ncbi:MAG: hypothetical protein AAGG75_15250 [Bacteroidota bacterium]